MSGQSPDETLDQAFGLPEVLVAVSISRLSCKRAGKTRTLMPIRHSSGESRFSCVELSGERYFSIGRHRMNTSWLLMAAGLIIGCCNVVLAQTPLVADLEPVRKLHVESSLTDDDGEVATDISGMACMPSVSATRSCLVINDQDRSAQFVTIEGDRVIGGPRLPLIEKQPPDAIIGQEPREVDCSGGKAKFKDLDGEGVAFAESYYYVAGSHGCSRNKDKFRLSSFI